MNALTIRDLSVVAGEPRVKDLLLAERLGFSDKHKVRNLIKRNKAELQSYGLVSAMVAETSNAPRRNGARAAGGRPGSDYYLNEPQALLICMFSQTDNAAAVRRQLIEVFMAYRAGELRAAPQPKGKRRLPPVYTAADPEHPDFRDPIKPLARRRDELVLFQAFESKRVDERLLAQLPHLLAPMSSRKIVKFPRWFFDKEVLSAVVRTHRQSEVGRVVELLEANFGYRAPSKSSLHRFWLRLDGLFGTGRKLH